MSIKLGVSDQITHPTPHAEFRYNRFKGGVAAYARISPLGVYFHRKNAEYRLFEKGARRRVDEWGGAQNHCSEWLLITAPSHCQFGQLIFWKIDKIVATRSHILKL